MWLEALTIPACGLISRMSGGGPTFYRAWVRKNAPWLDPFVDGDVLPPFLFAAVCALYMPWYWAIGAGVGYWIGKAPDVGQKVDALRKGDWRPAVFRGVFLGAAIALGSWNPAFIIAGALWPVWYWISLKVSPHDWWPAEVLTGLGIGVVLVLS